ncbi:MAG: protein containing Six-hairpin glycosidase-like domain protein [Methylococcaceae bacterium]|nr:protein containing Six-hairpin glycosidase-like domain protein [Methylococcaceae bacterium]
MNIQSNSHFKKLLVDIRNHFLLDTSFFVDEEINKEFDPDFSQIYITFFQEGIKPLRWGARRKNIETSIQRIAIKLKENPRLSEFSLDDPNQCRILFEMVVSHSPCNIRNLTTQHISENRFEPGVNGLKFDFEGVPRFFMPTDAITNSIMSVNQLLNHLSKKTGHSKRTNKISERVELMRREPIKYTFIKSIACVSYKEKAISLYRGYPDPLIFDKQVMYETLLKSIDWLVENMREDGRFLYFYDGIKDSQVDLDHPKMVDPLYNNILRHSGGTITLLRGYELTKRDIYLKAAKKSLDFLLSTFKKHRVNNQYACYPFFNNKSKLGGAGIALVALMHYTMQTDDQYYRKQIDGLVRHLLSRVDKDGEMIGYYIHPKFYDGKEIVDPSDKMKKELFSFYYPGEALLGLALYYRHIKTIDKQLKIEIYNKSLKSLDFLVDVRPIKYDYMFDTLPADAWLMQAIEEWIKVDGFKKQNYIDFVFNDTQTLFDHMYTEENAPTPDYVGGFFYHYGDHVYHDASRNEGVIAAYNLAKYLGENELSEKIMGNMLKSAKGLMHTLHSPESTYAHQYPKKSINSFRFKLTRQWVRVDSVQHTACFYARLYQTDFGNVENNNDKKKFILFESENGSFEQFFKKIRLLTPSNNAKKIVIVSEFIDVKKILNGTLDIEMYKTLIQAAQIDCLFTVENFREHVSVLDDISIWKNHADKVESIEGEIINSITPNDIVCVKGVKKSKLPELTEKLRKMLHDMNNNVS